MGQTTVVKQPQALLICTKYLCSLHYIASTEFHEILIDLMVDMKGDCLCPKLLSPTVEE